MSGLPNAKPTTLKAKGKGRVLSVKEEYAAARGGVGARGSAPAVDDAVELDRVVLPALGHSAHVFVDSRQHGHVTGPALSRHARVTDAPGPLLDGFADEKGCAWPALPIHFEETIGTAAVGAENEYAFGGARYVGYDGWHAMNDGGREVAELVSKGTRHADARGVLTHQRWI